MYFDKHYYVSMNARFVMSALCAKEFYQRDVHYIVKDGAVQIVDEVLFLPSIWNFALFPCIRIIPHELSYFSLLDEW